MQFLEVIHTESKFFGELQELLMHADFYVYQIDHFTTILDDINWVSSPFDFTLLPTSGKSAMRHILIDICNICICFDELRTLICINHGLSKNNDPKSCMLKHESKYQLLDLLVQCVLQVSIGTALSKT